LSAEPRDAVPGRQIHAEEFDQATPYVNHGPLVSVIIGSARGEATIGQTLRSLARQTLAYDRFEVVVVQNGEPDLTAKIVNEVRQEFPGFSVRRLEYRQRGAGRARNAGMAMARGQYVTFVDDDDTVSSSYLAALLACSGPRTVGVAHLADVVEGEPAPLFDNRLASQLVLSGRTVTPGQAISVMTYTVGKMLPTALARSVGFDPDLRSGEDIVFYLRFFMRHGLEVSFVPLDAHAVYYRAVVAGSLSRQALSYEFNVAQRLDVIERLESLTPTQGWHHIALRERTKAQTRAVNRYLRQHPDQRIRVLVDIRERGLTTVPLDLMTAGLGEDVHPIGSYSAPATSSQLSAAAAVLALAG
jgi:glycosyltransferase involved in cell wall biosynthesis